MCSDMNFSMRLSFYPNQQKAMISSDTVCLLNINDTLLYQRNVTNNYNCDVICDDFENQCVYTSITFYCFLFLWTLGEISAYSCLSISDAICFYTLGMWFNKDKFFKDNYRNYKNLITNKFDYELNFCNK